METEKPNQLQAKDYAEGKSQFEKRFPNYEDMPEEEVLHRKHVCEGWLAALKWASKVKYAQMIDDEIEAIENANDSKRI